MKRNSCVKKYGRVKKTKKAERMRVQRKNSKVKQPRVRNFKEE